MRTVILVGLILHLVISIVESDNDYQFGDIISFPRTVRGLNLTYKHYAVYVGQKDSFGQGADKDIFHRIRHAIDGKHCVFGSLSKERNHSKENYLDEALPKPSDEDIVKHVLAMIDHCGNYNFITNNCEHLATYVRYGRAYLKQLGTHAAYACRLIGGVKDCPEANEAVKKMSDEKVKQILDDLNENSRIEDQDQNQAVAAG